MNMRKLEKIHRQSLLDDILEKLVAEQCSVDSGEWPKDINEALTTKEAKQQIKDLMLKTYNHALQLYIDKQVTSIDDGMDKAVAEL